MSDTAAPGKVERRLTAQWRLGGDSPCEVCVSLSHQLQSQALKAGLQLFRREVAQAAEVRNV